MNTIFCLMEELKNLQSANDFNTPSEDDNIKALFAQQLIKNSIVSKYYDADTGQEVSNTIFEAKAMVSLEKAAKLILGAYTNSLSVTATGLVADFLPSNLTQFPASEATAISYINHLVKNCLKANITDGGSIYIPANAWSGLVSSVMGGILVMNTAIDTSNNIATGFSVNKVADDASIDVTISGTATVQGSQFLLKGGQCALVNSIVVTGSGTTGGVTNCAVTANSYEIVHMMKAVRKRVELLLKGQDVSLQTLLAA